MIYILILKLVFLNGLDLIMILLYHLFLLTKNSFFAINFVIQKKLYLILRSKKLKSKDFYQNQYIKIILLSF